MKFLLQQRFLGILLLMIGQLWLNPALSDDSNSAAAREKRVNDLKQKIESINYGAKKPKAIVYVFTDMNCDFCRKLHHEFPKLAEQGIQLRVLAMPRQGLDSPGYKEWVSIWCSKDQNDSLDRAMEGEEITPRTCQNPIKMHYSLGRKWGVIGTPSVLFSDGTLKAGYFSAEKLAKEAIKRTPAKEKEEEGKSNPDKNETINDKEKNKSSGTQDGDAKDHTKDKAKDQKDQEASKTQDKDKSKVGGGKNPDAKASTDKNDKSINQKP